MKIDFRTRAKNPYFWIGLIGVICTAIGVEPEMFTSWGILADKIIEVLSNPFMLVSVIATIIGVVCDSTTKGFSDMREKW